MSADAAAAALARVSSASAAESSSGASSVRASSAEEKKRLAAVIAATEEAEAAHLAAEAAREAALRKVPVVRADADFLAKEFELPLPLAERALRQHGGDFDRALAALLGSDTPAAAAVAAT